MVSEDSYFIIFDAKYGSELKRRLESFVWVWPFAVWQRFSSYWTFGLFYFFFVLLLLEFSIQVSKDSGAIIKNKK